MSINWIAEVSRISADVSRHERVSTERISNQSRNYRRTSSAVGIRGPRTGSAYPDDRRSGCRKAVLKSRQIT